jgi:hypothetical protein
LCLLYPISWFDHFLQYIITTIDLLSIATTISTTIAMGEIIITVSRKRGPGTSWTRSIIHLGKRDIKGVKKANNEDQDKGNRDKEIRPPGLRTSKKTFKPRRKKGTHPIYS